MKNKVIGYKERGKYRLWIIKEDIYYNVVISEYPYTFIKDGVYGHVVLVTADRYGDALLEAYAGKRENVSNR